MPQPHASGQSIRAVLDAIASFHPRWKDAESVWEGYRKDARRRGLKLPADFERTPSSYAQLQELFVFGEGLKPGSVEEPFTMISGRCLGATIMREKLPDLLGALMAPSMTVVDAVEELTRQFMKQYSATTYAVEIRREGDTVRLGLQYSDPAGMKKYLQSHKLDPGTCFERSVVGIAAVLDACLQSFVTPWGADDLYAKPDEGRIEVPLEGRSFNYPKLTASLTGFAQELKQRHEVNLHARDLERDIILQSPSMREKWGKISIAADTDEIMLLRGEPGTGKTFLARRIHEMSPRAEGPFVEVGLTADLGSDNFIQSQLFGHVRGAFTSAHEDKEGLFSNAKGGTIFLDEIGDASPELQAKLLRVIEQRVFRPLGSTQDVHADVRILTATNRNLESMVGEGKFRDDLYHRLNVIQIELPPLRERTREVPLLCDYFLRKLALEMKKPERDLDPAAQELIGSHDWPGNIRELIHALKHALIFSTGEAIGPKDLPEALQKAKGAPRKKIAAPGGSNDEVIDVSTLGRLLDAARGQAVPQDGRDAIPWHIEHAKKTWLEALIDHFDGNLRLITSYWDADSEKTVRTLIRKYGLWEKLEAARQRRS